MRSPTSELQRFKLAKRSTRKQGSSPDNYPVIAGNSSTTTLRKRVLGFVSCKLQSLCRGGSLLSVSWPSTFTIIIAFLTIFCLQHQIKERVRSSSVYLAHFHAQIVPEYCFGNHWANSMPTYSAPPVTSFAGVTSKYFAYYLAYNKWINKNDNWHTSEI